MEKLFDVFMMTFVALFLTVPFVSIFIILVWPELEKALDAAVVRWIVKIRKVKGIFDAKESRRQQEERIRLMRNIDHDIRVLKQRDIFLRAMVLEFAAEGKVEEIEGLDFIGPKNWRKKLADSKERLRTHEGYCESLFYTAPEWPKVRGYMKSLDRLNKKWGKEKARLYLRDAGIDMCKGGGCCSRSCGCCWRPRSMSPSGELYYSHCTVFCLCCIRERGLASLKQYAFRIPEWIYNKTPTEVAEAQLRLS